MDQSPSVPACTTNQLDGSLEESKQYSYSYPVQVAALTIGIPIITLGFIGNLMTIIAVIKTKALRTGANIFIISLSMFDLMYVTIVVPTTYVQFGTMDGYSAKYSATSILSKLISQLV